MEKAGVRQDDESIPDSEDLFRRIARDWIITDEATGTTRLTSGAFREKNREISVQLSSLTTPQACLEKGGGGIIGVVAVEAGQARSVGQNIARDPQPNDRAHALICGDQPKSVRKRLADMARWVHPSPSPLTS